MTFSNKGDRFSVSEIPDLSGKVAIVTGGNGGIGLEITRQLAAHGARVYMASRNEQKAQAAIKKLQEDFEKDESAPKPASLDVRFAELDLMHLSGAQTCAKSFLAQEQRLDILVCNAGIMAVDYQLTDDGIEQSFQVNHLTHFALFKALAPTMAKTAQQTGHPSRLVNLSSFAHNFVSYNPALHFDFSSKEAVNRHMGVGQIGKYMRYSQAKLAALLFAREVNQRFKPEEIRAGGVHPGFVASDLYKKTPLAPFAPLLFIPSSDGALSALAVATSPQIEKDGSWDVYRGTYGSPHKDSRESRDDKLRHDLWSLSEELTNTRGEASSASTQPQPNL